MSFISRFFNIFVGVFFIAFSIYLWNNPAETVVTYSIYLGITYVIGAIAVLAFVMLQGIKPVPWGNIIVSFIIGFTILSLPLLTTTVLLGIFIAAFLVMAIYYFLQVYNKQQKFQILHLALAIAAIVYGIFMLFNPILGLNTMAKLIAAFVFFNGLSYIFPSTKVQK
ncbi:DUF308 domain-containing protein [Gleimia sp. 6138-11-ORH1]|uniref:DUF308 domain-containing protein n=1 Tax=Gleimia sp. 6138-11-ORH1 TaxID=2973937 RepID=UPI002167FC6B|nr:DUF308 domain-containing protein [Gleimia sp. 6138-11-ORH1]MCS4484426.1 DUF308 domain-containing protein [Gleimia sp. 6138-11-ORH1]